MTTFATHTDAAVGAAERTACEAQGCCWQKVAGGVNGCFKPKQASWSTYEVLSSKSLGEAVHCYILSKMPHTYKCHYQNTRSGFLSSSQQAARAAVKKVSGWGGTAAAPNQCLLSLFYFSGWEYTCECHCKPLAVGA
jgi:hypothetical protein